MPGIKSFPVFGEQVEVLISGETTGGSSATIIQISPAGGGPPPHRHSNEDESFYVLEGDYEFLVDGEWVKASTGDAMHRRRGTVHTFRNCGSTTGRLLITVTPAGLEKYLEEISPLAIPEDIPRLVEISRKYGINFPDLPS